MKLRARRISPGRAAGSILVSRADFSFVGGVDPRTGRLRKAGGSARGSRLGGRVFAFPTGKGSTVGSYVLYGLVRAGVGPRAIINVRADGIVATGAVLSELPMVDSVDLGVFRPDDQVEVDADRGVVDLPHVRSVPVVTAILRNRGRVLLVKRSHRVGSFRGRWSAVSGYLEGDEDAQDRARQEIREETGLRRVRFRGTAPPVFTRNGETAYVVHPFLFDVDSRRVSLDWENVAYRWIDPHRIDSFRTVPRLKDVLLRVLPGQ